MSTTGTSAQTANGSVPGTTLASLPKSWTFTSSLPADPLFPTPAASHQTARDKIVPRQVRNALFTWVRPEGSRDPELLAVSPAALRDLGLGPAEAEAAAADPDFCATAAGNKLWGFDAATLGGPGYPWAQCYGGFQFGQWAGQLGDGRAISLFEGTNERTGRRYEVQLKGAGRTPYSRFADGKAVLRSSIREFVVSEALSALGIPTTRALALTLLPHERVRRERLEPGAIVVRMAETWLRLGSFDLLRARGDRALLRTLADYVAREVFGGWDKLPGRLEDPDAPSAAESSTSTATSTTTTTTTDDKDEDGGHKDESDHGTALLRTGIARDATEGPSASAENRYTRLYREMVRRNAATVAKWQAYGFMNGVLNTDNTSVAGLSIDFGPFAFLDDFDPSYTPNHDDHMLRYSYGNQPTIVWWNLVRLGEALGEMMGAGSDVDAQQYVDEGVRPEQEEELVARAQKLITQAGEEYKAVFLAEYKRAMAARLGILRVRGVDDDDDDILNELISPLLELLENFHLDFHHFFRRLSALPTRDLETEAQRRDKAAVFFHREGATGATPEAEQRSAIAEWLGRWRTRVLQDRDATRDAERSEAMRRVNPNFVPRGWILDEVIRRVEKQGERDVLRRIMHMSLHPFEESWHGRDFNGVPYEGDRDEEVRWTEDPPRAERAMQCSCSS